MSSIKYASSSVYRAPGNVFPFADVLYAGKVLCLLNKKEKDVLHYTLKRSILEPCLY